LQSANFPQCIARNGPTYGAASIEEEMPSEQGHTVAQGRRRARPPMKFLRNFVAISKISEKQFCRMYIARGDFRVRRHPARERKTTAKGIVASQPEKIHSKDSQTSLERGDFSSNRHPALSFCLSMIFPENRYTLFRIML
jgi:hypothetical protein